jgi:hypothetical protein
MPKECEFLALQELPLGTLSLLTVLLVTIPWSTARVVALDTRILEMLMEERVEAAISSTSGSSASKRANTFLILKFSIRMNLDIS